RLKLMEELGRQKRSGKFTYLDHETFSAISHWYYYAIRELVTLPGFVEDPEWICRALRFPLDPKEVVRTIQVLLKLGLLLRLENGQLKPSNGYLETSSDLASTAIRGFHEQAFENAKSSVRQASVEEREITGTTFTM